MEFYYEKVKNAIEAPKKICDIYEHDAVSVCMAQSWFKRFQFWNFDVKDAPCSGRPMIAKVDDIIEKIEQDRHIGSRDIVKELNIDHKTVLNHLNKAGYKKNTWCLGATWVNIEVFNRSNFYLRITCYNFLLRNYRNSTVTGLGFYFKNSKRWSNKMARIWFNEPLLNYGKTCFIIALKYEETFSPTHYKTFYQETFYNFLSKFKALFWKKDYILMIPSTVHC